MATFPTLTPSSRSFTPGRHPHSEIRTLDGLQSRVRTSNVLLEQRLRLTFVALTEDQMLSIRSHYVGQQGRFLSFDIPTSLLSGMAVPASFTPTGYSWIYATTPQIEDIGLQRYTVSVELVTVPPEGANINGAELSAASSFVPGGISISADNAGLNLTVTATVAGGIVADNTSAGLDLTIPASMTSGTAAGGGASDPNFSSVSLLLPMNGTNGSTTFTDASSNAFTVTAVGNAQISTAQSKWGGSSMLLDGTGDYLEIASNAAFAFAGDFTIEVWLRGNTYAPGFTITSSSGQNGNGEGFFHGWKLDTPYPNAWGFGRTNQSWLAFYPGAGTPQVNVWHHYAICRSGSAVRTFLDGTQLGNTNAAGIFDISITSLVIGTGFNGYMNDLRVTKGVARYTANFTPPTAAFPSG